MPLVTEWPPMIEFPVRAAVSIDREPRRGRCSNCARRRELYRVAISAGPHPDRTEARCAECWGIR